MLASRVPTPSVGTHAAPLRGASPADDWTFRPFAAPAPRSGEDGRSHAERGNEGPPYFFGTRTAKFADGTCWLPAPVAVPVTFTSALSAAAAVGAAVSSSSAAD